MKLETTLADALAEMPGSAAGTTRISDVLHASAEQGLLAELAERSPRFRDTFRAVAVDLLERELTEARTDSLIDYVLRVYPTRFAVVIRPVLDWLLPEKLIGIVQYVLYRPTHDDS